MKRIGRGLLLFAMVWTGATATAETNAVAALQALVRQWVDLRGELATEQRTAREQRSQLENEISLLEKERAALAAEVEAASEAQSQAEAKQLQVLTRRDRLAAVLDALEPVLDRAEAELRRWPPRLPDALRAPLEPAFAHLPAGASDARRLGAARRLQTVVALYAELESLAHGVHAKRQLMADGSGARREMDVFYVGLARGFAVAPDDRWAAVGTPSATGWQWESRPELAPAVRAALAMLQRERPAALVRLPFQAIEVTE